MLVLKNELNGIYGYIKMRMLYFLGPAGNLGMYNVGYILKDAAFLQHEEPQAINCWSDDMWLLLIQDLRYCILRVHAFVPLVG